MIVVVRPEARYACRRRAGIERLVRLFRSMLGGESPSAYDGATDPSRGSLVVAVRKEREVRRRRDVLALHILPATSKAVFTRCRRRRHVEAPLVDRLDDGAAPSRRHGWVRAARPWRERNENDSAGPPPAPRAGPARDGSSLIAVGFSNRKRDVPVLRQTRTADLPVEPQAFRRSANFEANRQRAPPDRGQVRAVCVARHHPRGVTIAQATARVDPGNSIGRPLRRSTWSPVISGRTGLVRPKRGILCHPPSEGRRRYGSSSAPRLLRLELRASAPPT